MKSEDHTIEKIRREGYVIFYNLLPDECLQQTGPDYPVLILVCSGSLNVADGLSTLHVKQGDYVFIKHGKDVSITMCSESGQPFSAIGIAFTQNLSTDFLKHHPEKKKTIQQELQSNKPTLKESAIPVLSDFFLEGIFTSLIPFLDPSGKGIDRRVTYINSEEDRNKFLDKKSEEALECLLDIDNQFYLALFKLRIEKKPKIDLKEYIEHHFTEDLPIETYALNSGRSLATFKRDFKKIYHCPPQKWLIDRRLQESLQFLSQGMGVTATGMAVGFKNRCHFIKSFKAKYGVSPSKWRKALDSNLKNC